MCFHRIAMIEIFTALQPYDELLNISIIKSQDDFIERDVVAPELKTKITVSAVPTNRGLQQVLTASSFRSERLDVSSSTRLKVEDKSSRSGEFKFKTAGSVAIR